MRKEITPAPMHDSVVDAMLEGERMNPEIIQQLRHESLPSGNVGLVPLADVLKGRPKTDPPETLANLKVKLGFSKERWWSVLRDTIGFKRRKGDKEVSYEDRMKKAREQGKTEAASWGSIKINGREATLFGMDWDFLLGTLGSAVGQTFFDAAEHARRENELFVGVFSSAGARQDEGNPGLLQMPRMVRSVDSFHKGKTDAPFVAVLSGHVWGGISASVVPLADVIVGIKGTEFGFAGPNVIEGYTREKVPQGAQSVEAHSIHRNVHVLVDNEDHLLEWLSDFERISSLARQKDKPSLQPSIPPVQRQEKKNGEEKNRLEQLHEQFLLLKDSADRPDADYLINHVFDESVPLYSKIETEKLIHYPGIIASLARIDSQVFLVIADQPSYQKTQNGLRKISSSPTPADYTYVQDMLEFGERLGVPVVSLVDTLGAKPTLEAEYQGQSRAIAKSTLKVNSYKYPILAIVNGFGGSGGAIGTMAIADNLAMTSDSMLSVAEPSSVASIVHRTSTPTLDQIKEIITGLRITADEQKDHKLIDEVIRMPEGIAGRNRETVAEFRSYIINTFLRLDAMSRHRKLERHRDKRMKDLAGMPLKRHGHHRD